MTPRLIVTRNGDVFVCEKEGDTGWPISGRGASVLEAVGSWCIYSGLVEVRCDPPEVLQSFTVVGLRHAPPKQRD